MGYFDSKNWEGIKKDLQKGLERGMAAVKRGAIVAQKRAGEITDEGRKQYKVMVIKSKVHTAVSDLGARVYAVLSGSKAKNPALDSKVKELIAKIRKHETEMKALEGSPKKTTKRKAGRA